MIKKLWRVFMKPLPVIGVFEKIGLASSFNAAWV
jgi:hypothetical protein